MQFGCQLEFVTNKSQEGSQFCRGFGGIGGILRYSVDTTLNEVIILALLTPWILLHRASRVGIRSLAANERHLHSRLG